MNVERSGLRSWLQQMIVVPQDERRTLRSTFAALQDERRTPRSTFGAPQDKMNVERSILRLWYPKMTRFTFGVPQDKHRTPRSTFGAPQERESRLHRFRPESLQQTLESQGAPSTERRTGRSHSLLAVAVVAFAEGPRGLAQSMEYHVRNAW